MPNEEEINALIYLSYTTEKAYLIVGGSTGQLGVLDIGSGKLIDTEQDFIPSETVALFHNQEHLVAFN